MDVSQSNNFHGGWFRLPLDVPFHVDPGFTNPNMLPPTDQHGSVHTPPFQEESSFLQRSVHFHLSRWESVWSVRNTPLGGEHLSPPKKNFAEPGLMSPGETRQPPSGAETNQVSRLPTSVLEPPKALAWKGSTTRILRRGHVVGS